MSFKRRQQQQQNKTEKRKKNVSAVCCVEHKSLVGHVKCVWLFLMEFLIEYIYFAKTVFVCQYQTAPQECKYYNEIRWKSWYQMVCKSACFLCGGWALSRLFISVAPWYAPWHWIGKRYLHLASPRAILKQIYSGLSETLE